MTGPSTGGSGDDVQQHQQHQQQQHQQQQGSGRHARQSFLWHAAAAGREDSLAAAEAGRGQQGLHHPAAYKDDAPMTPVVYLVLWTSVAVGALNGYVMQGTIAARQSRAYTFTFSHSLPGQALNRLMTPATSSPYCATGVDGLPGVSWYETVISVVPLIVAPLLGAMYVRHHGRTHTIMVGCVLMVVGLILMASALHVVQLYISYAVAHAARDVLYLGVLIQCVEVAPRTSRGRFLLVHILGQSLGACLVSVIGYVVASTSNLGWRLLLGMGVIPALAVLLVMPWMIDTPQSFIERGKYAKGWSALRDMRGPFYDDTYGEYMSIVAAAAVAPKGLGMYRALFSRRRYLPALCVGLLMAGLSAQMDPHSRSYVSYNTLVRYGTPLKMAALLTTLTQTVAYALGTIVCMILVDRVGRLPLLRVSSLLAITLSAVLVAASTIYAQEHNINLRSSTDMGPRGWPMLQLGALCVLSAGNGLAWASAVWVTIAESQALPVRPAAVALCLASSNLSSSVVEIYLLCVLKAYYYVFVLGVSCLALALSCLLVPETTRVPLECITDLYGQHWLWRHVVHPRQQPRGSRGNSKGAGGQGRGGGDGGTRDALHGHMPPPPPAGSPFADAAAAAALGALPPAAAAAAADALAPLPHHASAAAAAPPPPSPFGGKDVQLAEVGSGALAAAGRGSSDDGDSDGPSGRAAAAAAVAAATASAAAVALSIERGGAADAGALLQQQRQEQQWGRGLSGGGSLGSGRLLLGRARTSRGSGWLSSRLRSSMLPHGDDAGGSASLDGVVEQLADELRREGG